MEPVHCGFTVLIDTAESQPWTFQGLKADADKNGAPLYVPYEYRSLGRFPHSLGDYSIDGFVGRVAIERKSLEDCQATLLGWQTQYERANDLPGRRERFKSELANLEKLDAAVVVVEAEWREVFRSMPAWGTRTAAKNRKSFSRTHTSIIQDYRVPWQFCPSRREAEIWAYRWLEMWWKKQQ